MENISGKLKELLENNINNKLSNRLYMEYRKSNYDEFSFFTELTYFFRGII
jgi:hypothetical protein